MVISCRLIAMALGISLCALANHACAQENGAATVAEVNGQKLTRAELVQKQAAKLLQARYQYYFAEREALDQLIDGRLLEIEARRENLSVEQLLQREVTSKVKDPTELQLQVYYEGMHTKEPFAAIRGRFWTPPARFARRKPATPISRLCVTGQACALLLSPPRPRRRLTTLHGAARKMHRL